MLSAGLFSGVTAAATTPVTTPGPTLDAGNICGYNSINVLCPGKNSNTFTKSLHLTCFAFDPLTPTVAKWVHNVPDRVKPSFVIFDIRAL